MAITVNTNVTSMLAQRNLNSANGSMQQAMERLSSGLRINSAKDDAAGLQIANRLTSQIRGIDVAMRNANDGISIAQTAEGAMQESTNILHRMRDLALQAANDSNGTAERTAIGNEISALSAELTRISEKTEFGGVKLLDGSYTGKSFQIGAASGDTIGLSIGDFDSTALGVNALDVSDATNAGAAITAIDTAIGTIDTQRSTLGTFQNRLSHTINNQSNIQANVADARSRIQDVDFAKETAEMTKQQVLQQSGSAMLAQANQIPQLALSLLQ
ncbi:flagellin [Paraferrimonas sedimenticola]|uniref:Flagellin n=1 Tax=Paraferrimonas sedimenticola TaxID=375674 RepID=A0AA37RTH4_9GAMM|nr:flagellin [Paraferrimonas sedimenticola]GLP94984.1 flagellin [Paraferrimonas sedimenticola]